MTCLGNETRWIKPDGRHLTHSRGRVHIELRDETTLLLVFERINHNDDGRWTCLSEVDEVEKHFVMKVYEPISFEGVDLVQAAREDKDAIIQCKVKGVPQPEVSWDFNGQPLELISEYFAIKNGKWKIQVFPGKFKFKLYLFSWLFSLLYPYLKSTLLYEYHVKWKSKRTFFVLFS